MERIERKIDEMQQSINRLEAMLSEALAAKPARTYKPSTAATSRKAEIYAALMENSDALVGRMNFQEIAWAIGIEISRQDRMAMASALADFGAKRGKSGSSRYYIFGRS